MLIVGLSIPVGVKTIVGVEIIEILVVHEGYGSYTGSILLQSVRHVVQSSRTRRSSCHLLLPVS